MPQANTVVASTKTQKSKASITRAYNKAHQNALKIMWDFYKQNKTMLMPNIKIFRENIIQQLIAGNSAEQVFYKYYLSK